MQYRQSLPVSSNSKTHKPLKSFHPRFPLSLVSRHPLFFLLFSIASLAIGIGGYIVGLTNSAPAYVARCGGIEDTFRKFYSLSGSRFSHKNGSSDKNDGLIDRHELLGFVGIQTGYNSQDRRAALRSTWLPSDPEGLLKLERATGLAFRFVIGRTKDSNKMTALNEEITKYNDFFLIDTEEGYYNLKYKTLDFFKAAFLQFKADFYVKLDDDVYLRPDRLATVLAKERKHSMTYIGCMKKGPVITDPKMKWYESSGHLIGNEYFLHAYGPIYALSNEVVASLAASRNGSLRTFNNEDVTIGSWMLAMNVQHEHLSELCQTECTTTSIAVWDIPKCSGLCNPTVKLKELHKLDMCSKSPTLPSDR